MLFMSMVTKDSYCGTVQCGVWLLVFQSNILLSVCVFSPALYVPLWCQYPLSTYQSMQCPPPENQSIKFLFIWNTTIVHMNMWLYVHFFMSSISFCCIFLVRRLILVLLDSVGLGGEGRDRKREGQVMCGSFIAVSLIVCE